MHPTLRLLSFFCLIGTLVITCSPTSRTPAKNLSFAVLNVGQGLSQISITNDSAIVWDMGSASEWYRWYAGYLTLGSPPLQMIVLSHTDEDHRGGLSLLPELINFSGKVMVGYGADTALIRSEAGVWKNRIVFSVKGEDDSLCIDADVSVHFLWPPKEEIPENPLTSSEMKNRYSLCAQLRHKDCSVLITGDIDSIAMREIGKRKGYKITANILVVPHHGSSSALEPTFYGYSQPQWTIISCAPPPNEYGHPAQSVLDFLGALRYTTLSTFIHGSITFRSNGYYWERQ